MSIKTETRVIIPEEAGAILERNVNNRNVRPLKVQTYANDMKAGKWKLNGESIKFNGNGTLYDGQHRLLACVLAGKSFETVVVSGLTEAMHATLDVGMGRTLADELRWMGEKDVNSLASSLNLYWQYENGITHNRVSASRNQAIALLKRRPEIRDSMRAKAVGTKTGIMLSSLCAAVALMDTEHGAEVSDRFLQELGAGTGYVDGDPCLALRNYSINSSRLPMHRPGRVEWLAVILKTMNAWLLGNEMHQARWRKAGSRKETFPQLVSREMAADQ